MQETLVGALRARRGQIRRHWEALLRVERTTSPLAHPDSLVHLLDWAIDEILTTLQSGPGGKQASAFPPVGALRVECSCGRNPFLAFFLAGEQAMIEALVLAQTEIPALDATSRDTAVGELYVVLRRLRQQEIEAFCALCQYRSAPVPAAGGPAQPAAPCNRSR